MGDNWLEAYCPLKYLLWQDHMWNRTGGRLGFKVGPGSGIDFIVSCNHYHDIGQGLLNISSQETALNLLLDPVSSQPEIKSASPVNFGAHKLFIPDDGVPLISRHEFEESARIHLFALHLHAHVVGKKPERMEFWVTRGGNSQMLVNNSLPEGRESDHNLPSDLLTFRSGDELVTKCFYVTDPRPMYASG